MKKYKLIKDYPNAPAKVGTVFTHWTDGISVQYYNPTARCHYISESTILNYPEFWEEVVENPLFTTKDGVGIYEGDKYWASVGFEIYYSEAREGCNFKNTFSTKKAAEEYVLMNKPCLSINEVLTISYNAVETKSSTTKKLINLVKSKMK